MKYLEFQAFKQKLISEAYALLLRKPLKNPDRPYDPAFAPKENK